MLTLFALAMGTVAIGTGEFGSNGIIQLFAADLGESARMLPFRPRSKKPPAS